MAFTKKKKPPVLSKTERERIQKLLADEKSCKKNVKMQFTYKTPSGIEYVETARFVSVEDGLQYGKQNEELLKKKNKKWKLVSSIHINQHESQSDAQD